MFIIIVGKVIVSVYRVIHHQQMQRRNRIQARTKSTHYGFVGFWEYENYSKNVEKLDTNSFGIIHIV